MKRLLVILVMAVLLASWPTLASSTQVDLRIASPSAILVEASTGEVIWEKNSHARLPIASVTKIMVMTLVMEALASGRISLDDMVVTSPHAASMGGSQIWLEVGEQMAVSELLKAVAIESANDAAVALAEHVAGTEETFVAMMNEKAKSLGLTNTTFINATGLPGPTPSEDCFSTAHDIAMMSRELIKYPKIHEWLTIWIGHVRDGKNMLTNTNRLIRFYPGADGLKTGFTQRSRYCLAATAKRDGVRMISVVLGAETSDIRFNDASKLLDFGFRNFEAKSVAKKSQEIKVVKVLRGEPAQTSLIAEEDLSVVMRRGQQIKVDTVVALPDAIVAPLRQGEKVGELIAYVDGNAVARVNIVSSEDVRRAGLIPLIIRSTKEVVRSIFTLRK